MSDKKSANDIMRSAMARIEGIREEDVVFEDLSKQKKGQSKKQVQRDMSSSASLTINSGEGLELTDVHVATQEWDNIKCRAKRTYHMKESLDEWGAFDFFYFARNLYLKKYGQDWNLKVGGGSVEINKIRDKLSDIFGFTSNLLMRDYLIFFFKSYVDLYKKKGGFYFKQMRDDKHISYFRDHYDYKKSFNAYMHNEKKEESPVHDIKEIEISKSYQAGNTTLLCNYGLVISMNWLLLNKKMNIQDAHRWAEEYCCILKDKGLIGVVKNATEMYSPYPSWLPFQSPQDIFNQCGCAEKLNISFHEDKSNKQLSCLKKPF